MEAFFVRLKYPFESYLFGKKKEDLHFVFDFLESDFIVNVEFECDTACDIKTGYYCHTKSIIINLVSNKYLFNANNKNDCKKLYLIVIKILNKILTSIRVFGLSPYVYEESISENHTERFFYKCSAEYKFNDDKWTPLFKPEKHGLAATLAGISFPDNGKKCPEIKVIYRRDIIEGVINNISPLPEDESLANAKEFLWDNNYRMSIIESMIALEIVLARFYRKKLEQMKLSNTKINDYLDNFDLFHRFETARNFIIDKTSLQKIDMDNIRVLIKKRNSVVHRGEVLAIENENEKTRLSDAISNLFVFVNKLREEIRRIDEDPELQKISEIIKKKFNFKSVYFSILGKRNVILTISFIFKDDIPPKDVLEEVCRFSGQLLSVRNFDYKKDLYCRFLKFQNKLFAAYVNDKFEYFESVLSDAEY